jgi:membrane associated rhomboid family serine protease
MWMSFYFNARYDLGLTEYGLKPRTAGGLFGILTISFLHGDLGHILSNTFPILILGTLLFYHYREVAWQVLLFSVLSTGALVWLFGEKGSNHIGASGVLYALAGFLFVSGIIRRHKMLFGVSLLVTFLYGTIVWGILPPEFLQAIRFAPEKLNISWEGHLFGFLSGIALAFLYRKRGLQAPTYEWQQEDDDDLDDSDPYWMVDDEAAPPIPEPKDDLLKNTSDNPYTVSYTFIPRKKEPED